MTKWEKMCRKRKRKRKLDNMISVGERLENTDCLRCICMCGSSSPFNMVFMFEICVGSWVNVVWPTVSFFYASFWSLVVSYLCKNEDTLIFISWVSFALFIIIHFPVIPVILLFVCSVVWKWRTRIFVAHTTVTVLLWFIVR